MNKGRTQLRQADSNVEEEKYSRVFTGTNLDLGIRPDLEPKEKQNIGAHKKCDMSVCIYRLVNSLGFTPIKLQQLSPMRFIYFFLPGMTSGFTRNEIQETTTNRAEGR